MLYIELFEWIVVTEQFYKWIKQKENEYEPVLSDELKIQAFQMALDKRICLNTMNILAKIFNCNTSVDLMVKLIKESIKQKKYKEVSNWYLMKISFLLCSLCI